MELSQLRYFKKVAELQHMTKAANELLISQPSLSKIIKTLEEELGYELFTRSGKYILLNDNGKIFLKHVNSALNTLNNAAVELQEYNNKSNLSVTVSVMAAGKLLPSLVLGFKKKHPEIKLNIVNIERDNFEKSNYDLMLFTSIDDNEAENSITLYKEELFLTLPNNHPLANKKLINLKEIKDENFISPDKETSYCNMINHYCRLAGFKPNIAIEATYASTIKSLVKAGIGIAIMPELTWEENFDSDISFVKIKEPECYRYVKLIWKDTDYTTKAVKIFMDYLINFFKDFNDSKYNVTENKSPAI